MDDKLAEIERLKKFTEADSVRITEKIWEHILSTNKNLTPVTNPEGIITGGTPGAGKSVFVKLANKRLNNNLMTIDGDQFRQYHPNFQQLQKLVGPDIAFVTGPFYGKMVRNLLLLDSFHIIYLVNEATKQDLNYRHQLYMQQKLQHFR